MVWQDGGGLTEYEGQLFAMLTPGAESVGVNVIPEKHLLSASPQKKIIKT